VRSARVHKLRHSQRPGFPCSAWELKGGKKDGSLGQVSSRLLDDPPFYSLTTSPPGDLVCGIKEGRGEQVMRHDQPIQAPIPRWLHFVLASDRAGSAWYIGTGFFFAPVLAVLSPWPAVTAVLWGIIGVAGLWLGLLGVAMAVGLARILRSGAEVPEDYWRTLVNY
jgi:hypothetical protein